MECKDMKSFFLSSLFSSSLFLSSFFLHTPFLHLLCLHRCPSFHLLPSCLPFSSPDINYVERFMAKVNVRQSIYSHTVIIKLIINVIIIITAHYAPINKFLPPSFYRMIINNLTGVTSSLLQKIDWLLVSIRPTAAQNYN